MATKKTDEVKQDAGPALKIDKDAKTTPIAFYNANGQPLIGSEYEVLLAKAEIYDLMSGINQANARIRMLEGQIAKLQRK